MKNTFLTITLFFLTFFSFAQSAPNDFVGSYRGNNGTTYTFTTTGTYDGSLWGGSEGIYTDDSRLGKAAVHAGLLKPGETGSVTIEITEGRLSYIGSTRNGVTSTDYGSFGGSFRFAMASPFNMTGYRGNNGTTYTFNITGTSDGSVWGGLDNIYSDDSKLSTAAVHAGQVRVGETKSIKVNVLRGQKAYRGNTQYGITSNDYGAWAGSFSFGERYIVEVLDAPLNVREYRGNAGKVYTFKVTGSNTGNVWGGANGIYTDDSQLSAAAVHAGKVKVGQTATIRVRILKGQGAYKGSTKNGISAKDYATWDGSFMFD